jgi:thiol:disulfide interchange protein DsbD
MKNSQLQLQNKSFAMQKIAKVLLVLVTVFSAVFNLSAQDGNWADKISWSFKLEKVDDTHAFIVGTAKIKEGWHVFSVNHDPNKADLTGYPTKFTFGKSKDYKLVGKLQDGVKPHPVVDELGTSLYFEKTAVFKQQIEVLTEKSFDISFDYSFQICDVNGCIFPPDQTAKLKGSGFKPTAEAIAEAATIDTAAASPAESGKTNEGTKIQEKQEEVFPADSKKDKVDVNLWVIFFTGFAFGFAALFTPCVFPMIPMTVTFFTKQSGSRRKGIINALFYGFSIIVIYVSVGILVTVLTGSSATVYEFSTSAFLNLIFFAIFILFAFSFLGAFEIKMPSSWVNKADAKADKGGFVGIFFMAFTLVLVSFSCTGPIVGTALVQAISSGSIAAPAFIMGGVATGLALPFTLFAVFPSAMSSLPQSGGWLNSVKVVFGLLEIAMSLKFLSMVDLAYHWDILTREIFVAVWVAVFAIMGLYLLGKLRFSHDSPLEHLSVTRFMFALTSIVFAIYLLPGMWGAPLYMIDGIAPPRTHSEDNFRFVKGNPEVEGDTLFMRFKNEMHEVGDGSILVFHDLEKGREYARLANKPVLIDFTGFSCANCRKTENMVWTNDKVRSILQEQMVIISLYCDDREPLPIEEQVFSKELNGTKKNVGNKWSEYQIKKYGQLSQPLYIIQDVNGNDLSEPRGYDPNVDDYEKFLKKGIAKFKQIK